MKSLKSASWKNIGTFCIISIEEGGVFLSMRPSGIYGKSNSEIIVSCTSLMVGKSNYGSP
jgi:hypothetical protein